MTWPSRGQSEPNGYLRSESIYWEGSHSSTESRSAVGVLPESWGRKDRRNERTNKSQLCFSAPIHFEMLVAPDVTPNEPIFLIERPYDFQVEGTNSSIKYRRRGAGARIRI